MEFQSAWGLVATFQAFVQSYPGYLVTRILLGFCEGGFIPIRCIIIFDGISERTMPADSSCDPILI
jgi:predicted MFS family arabinose efflux permease